jgi:hypothetical protein
MAGNGNKGRMEKAKMRLSRPSRKAQIQTAVEDQMFTKNFYWTVCVLALLAILTGCSPKPSVPMAASAQQADQPAATALPSAAPTSISMKPTATATQVAAPTSTPIQATAASNPAVEQATKPAVVTEFIAKKPEDIAGTWYASYLTEPWHTQYNTDGTYLDLKSTGSGWEQRLRGQFWFEGSVFHTKNGLCEQEGLYEVHIVQHDGQNYEISFKLIQDACKDRAPMRSMIWVKPQ